MSLANELKGVFLFAGRIGRDGNETKKSFSTRSEALGFAQQWRNNN
jgi:hypothetical protein